MEKTEDIETKKQTAQQGLGSLKTRSKPLERKEGISEAGASRLEETRAFEHQEQTARKELENFRTRSKPKVENFERG